MNQQRHHAPEGDDATDRRLYTVKETAELLRISEWTTYQLLRDRKLTSFKIGSRRLIAGTDIDRFITEATDYNPMPGQR